MRVYLQSMDDFQAATSPKPVPAWLMTHENWNPRDTLAVCSNLTGRRFFHCCLYNIGEEGPWKSVKFQGLPETNELFPVLGSLPLGLLKF